MAVVGIELVREGGGDLRRHAPCVVWNQIDEANQLEHAQEAAGGGGGACQPTSGRERPAMAEEEKGGQQAKQSSRMAKGCV